MKSFRNFCFALIMGSGGGVLHSNSVDPGLQQEETVVAQERNDQTSNRKDAPRDRKQEQPAKILPAPDAPQPMSPERSKQHIRLPQGFRIELVAREPHVQDPSCMAFDERGQIFVCELHGYNIEGHIDVTELNKTGILDKKVRRIRWELQGGKIADEAKKRQFGVVKLLKDTDGDGVIDKSIVWAKDLPPCYGVVPARGGIIVVCAPDIVFLADTNGDDRPDIRQTLFSGFRPHVLERGINNPRWGLDHWIYVGAGGNGGTIRGPHLSESVELPHSDFRFKADGSAIEPVNGRVGTFGLTMNEIGDRFPSTGGRPAMYALPLPYHYLTRNPHVATPETNYSAATYGRGFRISQPHPWRVKRRQDPAWIRFYGERETNSNYFSGGCSNEFYGDDLFPEMYRGNVFYCEPSLNLIHRCVVERDGAGYKGRRADNEQESEFLASTDQWFRPMNLRVGPDGALYIVDMYREIIEDYSAIPRFLQQQYGLDNGAHHGRIWRLLPADGPKRTIEDVSRLNGASLVQVLEHSNLWRRLTAQRLLIERGNPSVADALAAQCAAQNRWQTNLHALYTLAGLDKLVPSQISVALRHEHYGVRLHALRLADRWMESDNRMIEQVVDMVDDSDPSVRLQLAMTLGQTKDPRAVEALLWLAQKHGQERWMDTAILSSCRDQAGTLLIRLLRQPFPNAGIRALLKPLAQTVAGRRDASSMSQALAMIAERQEQDVELCLSGFVDGLARSDDPPPTSPDGWASVAKLLHSESERLRSLATQLAAKLPLADSEQLANIFANAAKLAVDERQSLDQREQSMHVLASAPFDTVASAATKLLDARQPSTLQLAAIHTLTTSSDKRVGAVLLKHWKSFTPKVRKAVLEAIFARANRLPALLDALEKKIVERGDIRASQLEQMTSSRHQQIAERAKTIFANSTADAKLQQRMDQYQLALKKPRNMENGKQAFTKHCLNCHKLKDQGFEVGPGLGTISNRPDETLLLDLLDPSGRIEPEFRSYNVATVDGRTFTGILASESPTSIILRKEKGETDLILRKEIEIIKASNVSLMPENLHQQITPQDAADIIAFLRSAFSE